MPTSKQTPKKPTKIRVKNEESNRCRGFWKFNNSLIENEEYVLQMKKLILDTINELFIENILDYQAK